MESESENEDYYEYKEVDEEVFKVEKEYKEPSEEEFQQARARLLKKEPVAEEISEWEAKAAFFQHLTEGSKQVVK